MGIAQALFAFVLSLVMVACDGGAAATPTPGPGAPTPAPSETPVPGELATRQLTVSGAGVTREITAEIARTDAERQHGLMDRDSMPEGHGMLFLFREDGRVGFWMHNTRIPLTIAYLDQDGRVMELRDGTPLDERPITPKKPYRYVLEMNQGWFARHGLGVGAIVSIPEDVAAE